MKPKKHLGQNFLKSEAVLEQFLKACNLSRGDTVVEVGGGTGVITRVLAPKVKKLITFELDESLVEKYLLPLEKSFANLEVILGDILSKPIVNDQQPKAIVGAIPYQITSPLLHKIVKEFYNQSKKPKIVFIVQKEVAEKVVAKTPKASYISNFVSLYGKAEIVGLPILPSAFFPAPKVDSAILKISPHIEKQFEELPLDQFGKFLHHGFKNPRKMLNKVFSVEQLTRADIDPTLRPQNLSLDNWFELFATMVTPKASS